MYSEFRIEEFDLSPLELYEHAKKIIIGQDNALKMLSTAVVAHYSRCKHVFLNDSYKRYDFIKGNVLLVGDSGSGKTLIAKTIASEVGVPFYVADATSYTAEGYVGDDVENIIRRLYRLSKSNESVAEYGIVFIDEIDKLARPTKEAGLRDISGGSVQESLLKLIEGKEVSMVNANNPNHAKAPVVDTRNIFFILGGAFEGIENIVYSRLKKNNGLGFNSSVISPDIIKKEISEGKISLKIDDLRDYGMDKQLLGRIPNISNLKTLDKDSLYQILTLPDNPLIIGKEVEFADFQIKIHFTDDALRMIADKAYGLKLGARGLKSVIDQVTECFFFRLPSTDFASKIEDLYITPEVVMNPEKSLHDIIDNCSLILKPLRILSTEKDSEKPIVDQTGLSYIDFSRKALPSGANEGTVSASENNLSNLTIDQYKALLTPLISEKYIFSAFKHGYKKKMPPEELMSKIDYMGKYINEFSASFKQKYDITLIFSDDAKDKLINISLESKEVDFEDYFYTRVITHLEKPPVLRNFKGKEIYIDLATLISIKDYVESFGL